MLVAMTREEVEEMERRQKERIKEFNEAAEKYHLKTRLNLSRLGIVYGTKDQIEKNEYEGIVYFLNKIDASDIRQLTELLHFEFQ